WNGYNYQFFAVNDQIPQIDNSKSVLGGKDPLYNYSLNNPNGNFLQISPGQNLELDIYATSETKGTPFTVTILYTPLYVFLDENYVYNISNIPQQSPTYFKGTFTVPENSTINLKSGYDINLGGGHYILIDIVLSDGAGNLDEMPIVALLQTSSSGFDNLFLPIFFVLILFPLVILFYMMYRSSKKHTDEDMYFRLQQQQRYLNQLRNPPLTNNNQPPPLNQPPEDKFTPRFCGNCGSQVAPGESFCLECGKKI
ncbi:MAG: zinc ribbon domain-containing protein, partial [Candidatus Thorarchaeota archaeon]